MTKESNRIELGVDIIRVTQQYINTIITHQWNYNLLSAYLRALHASSRVGHTHEHLLVQLQHRRGDLPEGENEFTLDQHEAFYIEG